MLTIYSNHTVQWLGHPIDTERLRLSCIIGFSLNDPLFCNQPIVLTCNGIFEYAFKYTVSLFRDLTGYRIRERTQAKGSKDRTVCRIQNRNHKQHHLG